MKSFNNEGLFAFVLFICVTIICIVIVSLIGFLFLDESTTKERSNVHIVDADFDQTHYQYKIKR
ncbi:hypothetical protein [Bacillus solimangrovi]|uniref:Uncharacterized protein n=1 Tax=Bacillus solimangrovi TaxID=1305675 RepID=A0A1E5LJI3_9BACI|nr:hypothetical protein [Bacillus solimangrovi]OEH94235.1 hypothetical protein BFG57_09305 [Bacillus solimangrovi]